MYLEEIYQFLFVLPTLIMGCFCTPFLADEAGYFLGGLPAAFLELSDDFWSFSALLLPLVSI